MFTRLAVMTYDKLIEETMTDPRRTIYQPAPDTLDMDGVYVHNMVQEGHRLRSRIYVAEQIALSATRDQKLEAQAKVDAFTNALAAYNDFMKVRHAAEATNLFQK